MAFALWVVCFIAYALVMFIPAVVAGCRAHPKFASICGCCAVSLLLPHVWVVSLAWALNSPPANKGGGYPVGIPVAPAANAPRGPVPLAAVVREKGSWSLRLVAAIWIVAVPPVAGYVLLDATYPMKRLIFMPGGDSFGEGLCKDWAPEGGTCEWTGRRWKVHPGQGTSFSGDNSDYFITPQITEIYVFKSERFAAIARWKADEEFARSIIDNDVTVAVLMACDREYPGGTVHRGDAETPVAIYTKDGWTLDKTGRVFACIALYLQLVSQPTDDLSPGDKEFVQECRKILVPAKWRWSGGMLQKKEQPKDEFNVPRSPPRERLPGPGSGWPGESRP